MLKSRSTKRTLWQQDNRSKSNKDRLSSKILGRACHIFKHLATYIHEANGQGGVFSLLCCFARRSRQVPFLRRSDTNAHIQKPAGVPAGFWLLHGLSQIRRGWCLRRPVSKIYNTHKGNRQFVLRGVEGAAPYDCVGHGPINNRPSLIYRFTTTTIQPTVA